MSTPPNFAEYIRILGKGPKLSRSLTEDEAHAAMRMLLAGQAEPMQVGAFLCLLRVKTESPSEIAGIVRAARETLAQPAMAGAADLDWPSYAGKSRRLPWFLLAARLLADNGVRILIHGDAGRASDRLHAVDLLDQLDIRSVDGVAAATACLRERTIAYLPLANAQPRLSALLGLRALLGVRSPLNTALRQLNPLGAACQIIGVAHPAYRETHIGAAARLGQPHVAVFKGDGGEAERRPEKPCDVHMLHDGVATVEPYEAMLATAAPADDESLDPRRIAAAWTGAADDPVASAAVVGTAAIALRLLGRATSPAAAEAHAGEMWRARRRPMIEAA